MRVIDAVVVALAWALLSPVLAEATETQLAGNRLTLKSNAAGTGSLSWESKADFVPPIPNGAEDPRLHGATLSIQASSGESATLSLPAIGWTRYDFSDIWVFRNKLVPSSPVRKVIVGRGRIQVSARASGVTLDETAQGSIALSLVSGTRRYCTQFGDGYGSDTVSDRPGRFTGRSSPTTPWCSGCGDGVVAPTESCDDGNHNPIDGCASNCSTEGPTTCTRTTVRELQERALEDPNFPLIVGRATSLGYNTTTFVNPIKCTEGPDSPPTYIAIFPNQMPNKPPMAFLHRPDAHPTLRTFLVHRPNNNEAFVTSIPWSFHVIENTNPDTVEMLDFAGTVVQSGTFGTGSSLSSSEPGGAEAAALTTADSQAAECMRKINDFGSCTWTQFVWDTAMLAAIGTTGECAASIAAGGFALGSCTSVPALWVGLYAIDRPSCDDVRGPYPCTVSGPNGECYRGRCRFNLLQTSASCVPENPNKTACDANCNEVCENGLCRGFKILSAEPAGPVVIPSTNTAECADSIFGHGTCTNCQTSTPVINVEYCGSPRSPVTICLGQQSPGNIFCRTLSGFHSPMQWSGLYCCYGFTSNPAPLSAVDAIGETGGGAIPYGWRCQ
jgi:cysteine-rich repeat protein